MATSGRFANLVSTRCGKKLCVDWLDQHTPRECVQEGPRLHVLLCGEQYTRMTTITPAYYAEQYAPDDNPTIFVHSCYPRFTFAHRKIENELKMMEAGEAGGAGKK